MKTLFVILICFSQYAYAGAFAEFGLSARQQLSRLPDEYVNANGSPYKEHFWRMYDVNITKNPYCSVMLGYQWQLKPNFEFGLAIRHESSIATGKDRGINDARLFLRWAQ